VISEVFYNYAIPDDGYLLFAPDFYRVIVDSGYALINYHAIEIKSE